MNRPSRCFVAAVAALSLAGAAGVAAQTPKRGGTLVLVRQGEATNLDPHKVPAFTSHRVFELIYSTLTSLGPDGAVHPSLAESWTVAPDGRQITVKLRPAKFHTGDPVTSADVRFTFERILNPQTKAVARAFFGDVEKVDAPDPRTVVFTLKTPNVAILIYLAHPNADTTNGTVVVTRSDDRIEGTFSVTVVEYPGTALLPISGRFSVDGGYSMSCP